MTLYCVYSKDSSLQCICSVYTVKTEACNEPVVVIQYRQKLEITQ